MIYRCPLDAGIAIVALTPSDAAISREREGAGVGMRNRGPAQCELEDALAANVGLWSARRELGVALAFDRAS